MDDDSTDVAEDEDEDEDEDDSLRPNPFDLSEIETALDAAMKDINKKNLDTLLQTMNNDAEVMAEIATWDDKSPKSSTLLLALAVSRTRQYAEKMTDDLFKDQVEHTRTLLKLSDDIVDLRKRMSGPSIRWGRRRHNRPAAKQCAARQHSARLEQAGRGLRDGDQQRWRRRSRKPPGSPHENGQGPPDRDRGPGV